MSANWDDFAQAYVTAILWANAYTETADGLEQDEEAVHAYITPGDWWNDCGVDLTDAKEFFDVQESVLSTLDAPNGFASHGHDFALTRNGHGAGFWDRGYGPVGDALTDAAKAFGDHCVITDDGPTVTNL